MSLSNNIYNEKKYFTTLDGILLGNFTTYNSLDPQIISAFRDCPEATELNIFIDLYPMLRSILKYGGEIEDPTCFASTVLNMCIHYREFFRKKQVLTNIYLIYSSNVSPYYETLVPNYNYNMVQRLGNKEHMTFLNNNIKVLTDICSYLPNIYFMQTSTVESSAVMADIIEDNIGYGIPNLIISKDLYPLQLVGKYPKTSMLIPAKKRIDGVTKDESIILSSNDPYTFWKWYQNKREIKDENVLISTKYITLINALSRFPERNVKSIYTLSKVFKIFNNLVTNGLIDPNAEPVFSLMEPILSKVFPNINTSTIEMRYKALSVDYGKYLYSTSSEKKVRLQENIYNPDLVKQFNSVVFANNPLELDKL